MLPRTLRIARDTTLAHEFELEDRIASCPIEHSVKGMFFARFVDMAMKLGVTPESLSLDKPVEGARYVSFSDYPIRDYMRWANAAAKRKHPRVATSEALRRIAIEDFERYLASGLGKVMVAFLTDARSVMLRSGQIYGMVTKGPKIESAADGSEIRVRYREYHGPVECYPAGTLEGACRHFGANYEITVDVLSPIDADYHVRILD